MNVFHTTVKFMVGTEGFIVAIHDDDKKITDMRVHMIEHGKIYEAMPWTMEEMRELVESVQSEIP
jgi:hypothetical protein